MTIKNENNNLTFLCDIIDLDISEFSTGKTVHWLPAKNGQSIYFHDFKMNDSYSSSGLFWSSFLTPFIQHNSVLPSALETVFPDSKPIPHETVNLVAEMLVFFNHFAIEFEIDTLSRLSYKPSKRRNGVLESTNVNEFSQFVVSDEKNNQHQQEREEEEDTHSLEFFEGESIEVEVYSESQVNRNEIELNETETNTNSTSQNSTSNANNTNANTNANTNTNAFNQQPPLTTRQTKLYVGNSGFISSILYGSSFRVVLNGRVPVRLVGNIVRALTEYLQDVITIEEYYTILKGLGNDTLQFTVSHSNGRNFLTESDTFKTNNTLELVEYLNKNNGRKFSNGSDCNVYQLVDSSIPLAIRVRNFGGTKEFASFQSTQCTSSLLPPFEVLLLMSNVLIAGSLIGICVCGKFFCFFLNFFFFFFEKALVLASGCVGMLCWFLFGAITKKLHAQGRLSVPSFVNYTTIRLTLLTFSFSGRQQIVRFESEDAVPLAPVVGDENGNNNNDENNNNNDEGERNNNENNDLNDENSNNNNNNDMSDRDTNGDQNVQNEESSESERENRD